MNCTDACSSDYDPKYKFINQVRYYRQVHKWSQIKIQLLTKQLLIQSKIANLAENTATRQNPTSGIF